MLVVALEGWIDAGLAAATAAATLLSTTPHELVATFDADELIDFRARRPTLRIVNGVDTDLRWSAIRMHAATNRTGRTVLTLTGPEPDMRWHRFVAEVVQLASRLEVGLVVGLGAFPAPAVHQAAANAPKRGRKRFPLQRRSARSCPRFGAEAVRWRFLRATNGI